MVSFDLRYQREMVFNLRLQFFMWRLPHIFVHLRRDARAAEWGGLENRCAGNRTEGSNPSLSAFARRSFSEGGLRQRAHLFVKCICLYDGGLRRTRSAVIVTDSLLLSCVISGGHQVSLCSAKAAHCINLNVV